VAELTRYWFEFDWTEREPPAGARLGCGVTAYTYDDALNLLRDQLFEGGDLPPVAHVREDVDVTTLDQGHVIPNMRPPNWRGIWFPQT
jgi:hypothetical protein